MLGALSALYLNAMCDASDPNGKASVQTEAQQTNKRIT
jgi:hypothetical protein